jgi:hypothetical protein
MARGNGRLRRYRTGHASEHTRLIEEAAKAVLEPHGFRRNGQSRVWFADRRFWLGIVDFQPSPYLRGSFGYVAVHWLWGQPPHVLTFDRLRRVRGFGEFGFAVFESEEQFRPLVLQLAEETLAAAAEDQQHFQSIEQTAAALVHEQEQQDIAQAGWPAFHAGAAAVMAGRFDDAFRMLESVIQP